jgi:hypothetical protein
MFMDPYILLCRAEEAERRVADLELLLAQARVHAMTWETTAKDLRKQVQRMRMDCDTERIAKDHEPHDFHPEVTHESTR